MPDGVRCHKCDSEERAATGRKVLRRDICSACGADLHCCYNCRFFDPGKHNECAEPQAEYVQYKDEGNFCEYFDPGPNARVAAAGGARPVSDARSKFDALFKK